MTAAPRREAVSAIVLAHNEEEDLERCLRSVQWADEILVMDDHSDDRTPEIAARFGRMERRKLTRFDEQRNEALGLATHEWVLFVDADEEVSPALAEEIQAELCAPRADSYMVLRRNWFLGRPMSFGNWTKDTLVRLGRRERGRWEKPVHEQWIFATEPFLLREPLEHYGDRRYSDRLTKSNKYSTMVAEELFRAGRKGGGWRLLAWPAWKSFKSYVLKQGFRDGYHGLVWVGHVFFGEFAIQVKLWELHRAARGGE